MKTARDYSAYRKVYFKPEFGSCHACGSAISRHHVAWKKHIQTLKGGITAISYVYECSNNACRKSYRSTEADLLSLPFRTYGVYVIVEIGYLRHEEKRSIEETLGSIGSLGIEISRTECYELSHVFEELISIRPVDLDPDWFDTVMKNGG